MKTLHILDNTETILVLLVIGPGYGGMLHTNLLNI